MTLRESLLARRESAVRLGQEDSQSGKVTHVDFCCSLDLSFSWVVHFNLPVLPLGFPYFPCQHFSSWIFEPLTVAVSIILSHWQFCLSYLTELHSMDAVTALFHNLVIFSEVWARFPLARAKPCILATQQKSYRERGKVVRRRLKGATFIKHIYIYLIELERQTLF